MNSNVKIGLIVILGVIYVFVLVTKRIESVHVKLLGKFDQSHFSFSMKWPKTSGARINIGSVRGGMSGNIEFKIYKDNDVLFTIKHDITEQDKCITLDGEGVHGYEVAQIPKGLLKNDETYFVSGIFTEPRANDKYSIWLCYVAPWID